MPFHEFTITWISRPIRSAKTKCKENKYISVYKNNFVTVKNNLPPGVWDENLIIIQFGIGFLKLIRKNKIKN